MSVSGHGIGILIHGIKGEDGHWRCAVERSEIVFVEQPDSDTIDSFEQERHYDKTQFEYSFDEAFRKFDLWEWFLYRPLKIQPEFAESILKKFEERIDEYEKQFPTESPFEKYVRESRKDEWEKKAGIP